MMKKKYYLLAMTALIVPVHLMAQQDSCQTMPNIEYGRSMNYGLKESTTATAFADSERLSHRKSINTSDILYGMIPGLRAMQSTGAAWETAAGLSVRGKGTWNSTNPLILVDGFQRDLNAITPDEIESVTVLKDAVGTALYGIRGGNGVILVKTKRGHLGKPQIKFSYEFNLGEPRRKPEFVDAYTYANALNEARVNDGLDPRYSQQELDAFQSGAYPYAYPNVDWWGESLRNHSWGDNVTFSVSGGGPFVHYYTQLNYVNDGGILKPTSENDGYSTQFRYSRLSSRTNLDIFLSRFTTVKLNLFANFSEHNRPSSSTGNIFGALYQVPAAAFPIKDENNVWGGTTDYSNNPIAQIAGTGYARSQVRNIYADLDLNEKLDFWVKGLSVGLRLGLDNSASYWDSNSRNFKYEETIYNWDTQAYEHQVLRNETSLSFSHSVGSSSNHFHFNAYADYHNTWGQHQLSAGLLYGMDKINAKGQNNSYSYIDMVGQAHYTYQGRYIADLSLSGSAASVLRPGHRWGFFPAVGAAWLISEEAFAKADWLNLLKLRASYGISGRADYPYDLDVDMYGNGGSYYFGKTPTGSTGLKITQLGMRDLTYEKSYKWNVGLDFQAFQRLTASVDAFYDKRTDILVGAGGTVSSIFGAPVSYKNNGRVDNYGVDADLHWRDRIGNLSYMVGGNLSFARNKIKQENEQYRAYDYLKRTGRPLGQYFGYEVIGMYQSQEEIDNSKVKQNLSEVHPGDLIYKDQNGDGVIDSYDQVPFGYSSHPELYYSFDLNVEYKGFGIYALMQGAANRSVVESTPSMYWPMYSHRTISKEYYQNRWTPDTPNAKYPRLTSTGSANNYTNNTLWIHNGSFLKMRTLEVYYNFPKGMLERTKILHGVKVYARAYDLFSLDSIKKMDPENMGTSHPSMTHYALGFNLTF